MLVFSKKIIKFIEEIKKTVKDVLSKEIGLRVYGDRFDDKDRRFSYPIKVVIFNNKSMLGYFDSDFYQLAFHENLMHISKEKLRDIIRHELAHYMIFISNKFPVQAHGPEFRAFCISMGWSGQVYNATTCLDDGMEFSNHQENSVLRKVQKLMALSTSSNENEAEQAMIKSRQLLLKYNMTSEYIKDCSDEDEKIYLKRILKQKKANGKMRAISHILETFFVSVVYNRVGGFIFLEIVGNYANIEIAEYVANFLEDELERLWIHQKKQYTELKGMVAKNSFFQGVAKGYCSKIDFLKRECNIEMTKALMVIEKKLVEASSMIYSRLRSTKIKSGFCHDSSALGVKVGETLNINPGIDISKKSRAFLSYSER